MEQNKKCPGCQSCLMPFNKDTGVRESDIYCSLCFKDGKLCYEGDDLKDFQKIVYQNMRKNGLGWFKAKLYTYMIRFAPRWRNK